MWIARYWQDGVAEDGTPKRVRRSEVLGPVSQISTRREAEQLLAQRLAHVNGGFRPRFDRTFRDFVENDWKPQIFPTLKHSTQQNYGYMLAAHLLPALGEMTLPMISREGVQALFAAKLSALSHGTVKRMRVLLGTILAAAEMWGYVPDNVVRKTRLPRRRGLQPDKVICEPRVVINLVEALPEPSRSLLLLIVLTGLRIGELLALRKRDVNLDAGTLYVTRTVYEGHFDDPKTQRSRREVYFGPSAKAVFGMWMSRLSDLNCLIFASRVGTPLSRRNLLRRQLHPTARKLGLGVVTWHSFRHHNASYQAAIGTPMAVNSPSLGHSSPETTRIYVHPLPTEARKAAEKLEQFVIGPKRTQIEEIPQTGSSLIQ